MALPIGLKPGLKAKTIVRGDGIEDEYGATCLAYAVVYRKNGKPIKNDEVNEEIKEQLNATMLVGVPQVERPVIDEVAEIDPAVLEQVAVQLTQVPNPQYTPSVFEQAVDELGFEGSEAPVIDLSAELEAAEARSVDSVNLRELAKALYNRFGVYTVYLNTTPTREDISPITGAVMNSLSLGQASQGFRSAQRMGTSWNPEVIRAQINSSRNLRNTEVSLPTSAMQANQHVGAVYGDEINMPAMPGEPDRNYNRAFESPHQSAVKALRGKESDGLDADEVYAEPPINARSPIIRPFVTNRRSQEQLERISRERIMPGQNVNFDDIV